MENSITLGMGCFWGAEESFIDQRGVLSTEVGFIGGTTPEPSYKEVCGGQTGHAEVVRIKYDPDLISLEEILDIFWKNHDPTTVNRQGPDIGDQYRSAIFYSTPEQKITAELSLQEAAASGRYSRPIVTEVVAAGPFQAAEEYHQQYFRK